MTAKTICKFHVALMDMFNYSKARYCNYDTELIFKVEDSVLYSITSDVWLLTEDSKEGITYHWDNVYDDIECLMEANYFKIEDGIEP